MRILFITQTLPYPPDAGPKVKSWHVLRYLSEAGHRITLVSFVRFGEEQVLDPLLQVCDSVHTVPIRRSRISDIAYWLLSLVTRRPFLIERDDRKQMRELVNSLLVSSSFDVIHADQLSMAQFAMKAREELHGLPGFPLLIFDAHNAVWKIVDRAKERSSTPRKHVLDLEARRLKRYEGQIVRQFDRTLVVSEIDGSAMKEASVYGVGGRERVNGDRPIDPRISAIPIGVDTERLQPIPRPVTSFDILTLGTLHYPPNADGVRWFLLRVFSLIQTRVPEAKLTIIGKNPPRDIRSIGANSGGAIKIAGYAPDLIPFFERAALMVVPVQVAGGMRVRILEGFARGIPMVTTTLGLEGIEAEPGRHILVSDTPEEFAAKVIELLREEGMRTDLSGNGRRLVVERYDWRNALEPLDEIYANVSIEAYAV